MVILHTARFQEHVHCIQAEDSARTLVPESKNAFKSRNTQMFRRANVNENPIDQAVIMDRKIE